MSTLPRIRVALASAPSLGKVKIRQGAEYRLIDKDGNEADVSLLGIYAGEFVIAPTGKKKTSETIRSAERFKVLRAALLAAGVADLFRR